MMMITSRRDRRKVNRKTNCLTSRPIRLRLRDPREIADRSPVYLERANLELGKRAPANHRLANPVQANLALEHHAQVRRARANLAPVKRERATHAPVNHALVDLEPLAGSIRRSTESIALHRRPMVATISSISWTSNKPCQATAMSSHSNSPSPCCPLS
jgi:hypothetical protein